MESQGYTGADPWMTGMHVVDITEQCTRPKRTRGARTRNEGSSFKSRRDWQRSVEFRN